MRHKDHKYDAQQVIRQSHLKKRIEAAKQQNSINQWNERVKLLQRKQEVLKSLVEQHKQTQKIAEAILSKDHEKTLQNIRYLVTKGPSGGFAKEMAKWEQINAKLAKEEKVIEKHIYQCKALNQSLIDAQQRGEIKVDYPPGYKKLSQLEVVDMASGVLLTSFIMIKELKRRSSAYLELKTKKQLTKKNIYSKSEENNLATQNKMRKRLKKRR